MIERDIPKQPATPAQAGEMFTGIGELTALKGKNYGDTHAFGEVPVTVPDEVAAHFPVPDSTSLEVRHTVYVTQKTLDGLFYHISLEEQKIRKDPAARVTDILKKVFANQNS